MIMERSPQSSHLTPSRGSNREIEALFAWLRTRRGARAGCNLISSQGGKQQPSPPPVQLGSLRVSQYKYVGPGDLAANHQYVGEILCKFTVGSVYCTEIQSNIGRLATGCWRLNVWSDSRLTFKGDFAEIVTGCPTQKSLPGLNILSEARN